MLFVCIFNGVMNKEDEAYSVFFIRCEWSNLVGMAAKMAADFFTSDQQFMNTTGVNIY